MTDLNSDVAPESGTGSDADRLSMSPQSIRNGGADPVDINQNSPGSQNFGELNYDRNTRESFGTDPWATGAGESGGKGVAPGPEKH